MNLLGEKTLRETLNTEVLEGDQAETIESTVVEVTAKIERSSQLLSLLAVPP